MIVRATLIKLQTDDGFFTLREHVSVGKTYFVDLDSIIRNKGITHVHCGDYCRHAPVTLPYDFTADIITVLDPGGVKWFPLELLRLDIVPNIGTRPGIA